MERRNGSELHLLPYTSSPLRLGVHHVPGLRGRLFSGNKKPVVWLVMVWAFLLCAAVWLNVR